MSALEPAIGATYRAGDLIVEVRAVCQSHVVCDGERVFPRPEFIQQFSRMADAPPDPMEAAP